MSITAYTGLPGAGKSHGVVKHVIVPKLQKSKKLRDSGKIGIKVYTNIPCVDEAMIERFDQTVEQIDMEKLLSPEWDWKKEIENGSLVVLDELWRIWPSGTTANKARQTDKEFLAEHRHLVGENGQSTEVVLVSQDLGQVAAFVRQLIAYTYIARKLDNVGADNRYNVNIYNGAVTGASPPQSKHVRSITGQKYDPEIFKLYKSATKSTTGDVGEEKTTDDRNNGLKAQLPIAIGSLLVLAFSLYWVTTNVFGGTKKDKQQEQPETVISVEQQQEQSKLLLENQKLKRQLLEKENKKQDDFLTSVREVSIEIANKQGHYYEYTFKVITTEGEFTAGKKVINRLGVRIDSINECVARMVSASVERLVYCSSDTQTNTGIFGISE